MADQQVLRGVSATLSRQSTDSDGNPAAPAGTVTIGVVDAAGNTVVASGTATSGTGTAPRTYTLTAEQTSDLNLLTATWTDSGGGTFTTTVEIVGGYFFTVAEARAAAPAMTDDTNFPTDKIIEARRAIEEEFELICGRAFVPRFRRQMIWPYRSGRVLLDQRYVRRIRGIAQVATDGTETPWTSTELGQLVLDGSWLLTRTGYGYMTETVVTYEHGYDQPPAEIKRAAFMRLRYLVSKPSSGIPDRATTFTITEGGTYSLSMPGAYKTGQPDVDAILGRYPRVPGLA